MFEIFSRDKDNKEEGNEKKMDANDLINYLPITKLGKKFDNKYNIEFKCIICYEDFKENDNITTLPCDHVFHIDCIKNLILAKKKVFFKVIYQYNKRHDYPELCFLFTKS